VQADVPVGSTGCLGSEPRTPKPSRISTLPVGGVCRAGGQARSRSPRALALVTPVWPSIRAERHARAFVAGQGVGSPPSPRPPHLPHEPQRICRMNRICHAHRAVLPHARRSHTGRTATRTLPHQRTPVAPAHAGHICHAGPVRQSAVQRPIRRTSAVVVQATPATTRHLHLPGHTPRSAGVGSSVA
jgi:hypothetical protein